MTDAAEAVLSDAEQAVISSYGWQLFDDSAGNRALRFGILRAAALVIADAALGSEEPIEAFAPMVEDLRDDVRQLVVANRPDLSLN